MEQRLSIVTLGVTDVPASRAFYERLGWKASSVGAPAIAFFQCGGMILALYGRDELAKDAGLPAAGNGFGGVTLAQNVRSKAEVDAVLAGAQKAGGRIIAPAEDKFWGGYSGYFADPDGHPWEVAWNPAFTIRDDGSVVLPE
jgi:catechol 2,3-dioxygenase-like lactoylglutathione lyase family enzyme